jgi:hypothetical protein
MQLYMWNASLGMVNKAGMKLQLASSNPLVRIDWSENIEETSTIICLDDEKHQKLVDIVVVAFEKLGANRN